MLDPEPQMLEVMQARYPEAIATEFDAVAYERGEMREPRPGEVRKHVFDFTDGVRLIVSKTKFPQGSGVQVSASTFGTMTQHVATGKMDPQFFVEIVKRHYKEISGDAREMELMGFSEGKRVPHFVVWDKKPLVIHGIVSLNLENIDPQTGKPCLLLTWPDGTQVACTLNIGEMIGGAATGARLRWEDQQAAKK